MKEFIKKLIGRLKKYQIEYKSGFGELTDETVFRVMENVIYTIKELAEEYNNGWIPFDCHLVPTDYCIVQIQEDNGYLWIPKVGEYRASTGKWRIEGAFEHSNGWLEDTEHFKVIAWQPLPARYQSKGE